MAKKERLGSDPLSFIKDTRAGETPGAAKPAVREPEKDPGPEKAEASGEEKPAEKKKDVKNEAAPAGIINAEKLSMKLQEESAGRIVISFDGEMSIYNVRQIKDSLLNSIRNYIGIELDLSKVNKIDTAGYQIIIAAKKEALEKGKSIRLLNPTGEVKNIFSLYGEPLK